MCSWSCFHMCGAAHQLPAGSQELALTMLCQMRAAVSKAKEAAPAPPKRLDASSIAAARESSAAVGRPGSQPAMCQRGTVTLSADG
jgi:hypothetical protein